MLKMYCATCCYRAKQQNICMLSKMPINPEEDYCSKYQKEFTYCDYCGNAMVAPIYIEVRDNGDVYQYCSRCKELRSTCQLCSRVQSCEFMTNPDPMPHVVTKTVRQGNMVMQTQVKNEERVKKFCHGCSCWSGESCCKDFNEGCINFTSRSS